MAALAQKSLSKAISFRCYAELNDFLPENKRQKSFVLSLKTPVSVGEAIEYLGKDVLDPKVRVTAAFLRAVFLFDKLSNGNTGYIFHGKYTGVGIVPVDPGDDNAFFF